jgi:hypothetical protein
MLRFKDTLPLRGESSALGGTVPVRLGGGLGFLSTRGPGFTPVIDPALDGSCGLRVGAWVGREELEGFGSDGWISEAGTVGIELIDQSWLSKCSQAVTAGENARLT